MHVLGNDGMPRRIYTYAADQGWDAWNMVATIGSFLIAVSILVFFYNVFVSLLNGDDAGDDPWDGQTLEWAIPSPPPVHNFTTVPVVGSNRPHWDAKYGDAPLHTADPEETAGEIHMPPPSYWPVFVALWLSLAGVGLLYSYPLLAVSMLATIAGIMAWAKEPVELPHDGSDGQAH
jgi:cytochrome c oxidase subunit 1